MSNTIAVQSTALVSLPGGITIPAAAPVKAARDCAKKLLQLAGESALAAGKVTAEQSYAFGLGLAILGATDNQSAPLERVKAYMGEKPNKAAATRLQYWINCTAAGKAAWKNGADSVELLAVISHDDVAAMSAAALEKLAADKKAAAALAAEKGANQKRIEATEEAAARIATEAARKAEEAAAAIHAAAYADKSAEALDNTAAPAYFKASEEAAALATAKAEAAAAAAASKAAWLEAAAAATVADVMTNKAKAAAAFSSLAAALGIDLTADQKTALVGIVSEQGQAAEFSAAKAEAAAAAKAEAAAASEQAALVTGIAKAKRKAAAKAA